MVRHKVAEPADQSEFPQCFRYISTLPNNFCLFAFQFLTKQTAALKEVNESRVRVYEQLEESLEELEQDHTKLSEQSREERGRIQTLSSTVTVLETRWPATVI